MRFGKGRYELVAKESDKLDPVQASAIDFAVAQEGEKKVEKVGGGGDAGSAAKLTRIVWRRADGLL